MESASPEKIADLETALVPIGDLKPHPKNPRRHPDAGTPAFETLRASLAHDYFDPLVWNRRNGCLVSGHFRRKVMLADAVTAVRVVVVDYDEATHVARMIAANRLLGEWDEELLATLARELEQSGLAADLAGMSEKDLAALLDGPQVTDDTAAAVELVSQAEEIQREWQVRLGDLYALGAHRVLCGDCTKAESWRLLLGDRLADIVWTDPPYNVDYDDIQRRRIALKAEKGQRVHTAPEAILNDSLSDDDYSRLLLACFTVAHQFTKEGGALYVAHADNHGYQTRRAVAEAGWHVAQCLIWVKNAFTPGRQDHQWQHEPILYGWKLGAAHYWQGGFSEATVLDDEPDLRKADKARLIEIINDLRNARDTTIVREPRNTGNSLHPTVKPLPLVARQTWNSSRRGETVLELFGGSGTTLLAAEQTGRACVATELDPKFCAVILERARRHGLTVEKIRDGAAPA